MKKLFLLLHLAAAMTMVLGGCSTPDYSIVGQGETIYVEVEGETVYVEVEVPVYIEVEVPGRFARAKNPYTICGVHYLGIEIERLFLKLTVNKYDL